LWYSIIFVINI